MNFAVAALLGLVSASNIQMPTLEWNPPNTQQLKTDTMAYLSKVQVEDLTDKQLIEKDFLQAVAKLDVSAYVSFGKNVSPLSKDFADFIKSLNVGPTCNQAIATECVDKYYKNFVTNAAPEYLAKNQMMTCVQTNAGCATKFDKLTPPQKEALCTKFGTDLKTLG